MSGTTQVYDSAVSSMTRLAQGLTGMRAGCSLQWDLLRAQEEAKRTGKPVKDLEQEKQVLDTFRERAGPSLRQLAVRYYSFLVLVHRRWLIRSHLPSSIRASKSSPSFAPLSSRQTLVVYIGKLSNMETTTKRERFRPNHCFTFDQSSIRVSFCSSVSILARSK
jgi:hypothetical protein